eukprot:298845-Prorocentrum_minimum.AAC.2
MAIDEVTHTHVAPNLLGLAWRGRSVILPLHSYSLNISFTSPQLNASTRSNRFIPYPPHMPLPFNINTTATQFSFWSVASYTCFLIQHLRFDPAPPYLLYFALPHGRDSDLMRTVRGRGMAAGYKDPHAVKLP